MALKPKKKPIVKKPVRNQPPGTRDRPLTKKGPKRASRKA